MNLVQDINHRPSLSQISEIEPYIICIHFHDIALGMDMQNMKTKLNILIKNSNEKRVYVIFDISDCITSDLETGIILLDSLISTRKLMSVIFYGENDIKGQLIYYLQEKAAYITIYLSENESKAISKARELYSNNQVKYVTFGPSYYNGVTKDEVIISGKTHLLVHDKKWSYTHPDETYFYRVDLIDSDILISKPAGYLNYKKVLVTNVLFDQVVNRVIGQKKQYYQMIDFSDVMSCTMSVKRNIINNIERTAYMVFYGLSAHLKMVVYLKKQFHPNYGRIMIADSYEEAVTMILLHKYGSDYFKPKNLNN